eukprot:4130324-Amphidinium_carterae.1
MWKAGVKTKLHVRHSDCLHKLLQACVRSSDDLLRLHMFSHVAPKRICRGNRYNVELNQWNTGSAKVSSQACSSAFQGE